MYCSKCASPLEPTARFCPLCGTARDLSTFQSSTAPPFRPAGRLVRPRARRVVAGVCAGFADHYGWDLNLVRVLTVVVTLFTGVTLFAYIAAWIILPEGQYALPFAAPAAPPPQPADASAAQGSVTP